MNFIVAALLLCFGFLSLLPPLANQLLSGYNSYDVQRICEVGLLGVLCAIVLVTPALLATATKSLSQLPTRAQQLSSIIIALLISASTLAHFPQWSFCEVSVILGLLALFFLFAGLYQTQMAQMQKITLTLCVSFAFCYIVYFLYFYLTMLWQTPTAVLKQYPGFVNLRFFAEFQLWTLATVTWIWRHKSMPRMARIILFLIASIWWTLAIANGAKGLWLGYIIGFSLVLSLSKQRKLLLQAHLPILTAVFFYFLLFVAAPRFLNSTSDQLDVSMLRRNTYSVQESVDARGKMWVIAYNLIKQHPLLGVGPLHYAETRNDYGAHPHNAILQIACEWGLPAALLSLVLILWGIYAWLTRYYLWNPTTVTSSLWVDALSITLISNIIFAMVSGVIVSPMSQVMLALFGGVMLGHYQQQTITDSLKTKTSWLFNAALFMLAGISLLLAIGLIVPQIPSLSAREIHWFFEHGRAPFHPRFWLLGGL